MRLTAAHHDSRKSRCKRNKRPTHLIGANRVAQPAARIPPRPHQRRQPPSIPLSPSVAKWQASVKYAGKKPPDPTNNSHDVCFFSPCPARRDKRSTGDLEETPLQFRRKADERTKRLAKNSFPTSQRHAHDLESRCARETPSLPPPSWWEARQGTKARASIPLGQPRQVGRSSTNKLRRPSGVVQKGG